MLKLKFLIASMFALSLSACVTVYNVPAEEYEEFFQKNPTASNAIKKEATPDSTSTTPKAPDPTPEHTHAHSHAHEHLHGGWGYAGSAIPPEKWGDQEVNRLCKAGLEQSPINVTEVVRPVADSEGNIALKSSYTATDFEVINDGHTIVFNAKDPNTNTISINGVSHRLLQFHYHIPSEHTVMDIHYPLEIHFVHANEKGGLAVVGVLVDKGKANPHLDKILTGLPANAHAPKGTLSGFNVDNLMPKEGSTYTYNGSLTTPPCSEKVQWLLKSKPITASTEQLAVLAELHDGNNRPVQPQGERIIYLVE